MPDESIPDQPFTKMEQALRDLRAPLGEIVLHFADLEDRVTTAINLLLRLTHAEGIVLETVTRDFGSRIKLFEALIILNAKNDSLKKLGLRVISLICQANSDRNNLLHDAWNNYSPEDDTLNKIRFVLKNGEIDSPYVYHVSRDLLAKSTAFIERVGLLVSDWSNRHRLHDSQHTHALPAPLPDIWYAGSPLHTHMKNQKKKRGLTPPQS